MRTSRFPASPLALTATLLALGVPGSAARAADAPAAPPDTRVAVVRDTLHGVVLEDPYRWLEDKDSPETRAWERAQMAYTRAQIDAVPGREQVKGTVARFTRLETRTRPVVAAGRLFFTARTADQQQPVLMMRASADGPDVVLADPNPLSPDHTTSVAIEGVSTDGRLIAYSVRRGGEDESAIHLMDVDTRNEKPGGLPRARYLSFAIDAVKRGCWYSRWAPTGARVWYHRFGDAPAQDRVVFGEGLGPTDIPVVQVSENGRWLAVTVLHGSASVDTRIYLRSAAGEGAFTSVTDTLHALVRASFAGDRLVIRTDWQAPNGRLMIADAAAPGLAHWREFVPERKDAAIAAVTTACGRVFVKYLKDVVAEIDAFGPDGKPLGAVTLPGPGDADAPAAPWSAREAFYTYQSFNHPPTIFRWDAASGASREWWRSPAPLDPDRYAVRQEWATSKDGTKVPMFIAAPKGATPNGSHPVLMTGYGGFGLDMTPVFSPRAAAWLEMGGVFVLTDLRGGGEFGERWHRDGMLANKQHTFDDFIACGQWLVDHGWCTPSKLAIFGGSNGGLLVGAAMTQRPDLFGAVLCEFPLLDMVRYHRFLVARFWTPEYGSSEDATQFQWLRAYSPYQNVRAGVTYPPIMVVSGDSDTRVDPLHARKMAALLQSLHGPNPVWLHYDVSSGHAGGKAVDQAIEDMTDEMQFLRAELGMAR